MTKSKPKSWVPVEATSDFPIENLPFGVFKPKSGGRRVGVAIGTKVLDLSALAENGLFADLAIPPAVFSSEVLNPLLKSGKQIMSALRNRIAELLGDENQELRGNPELAERSLFDGKEVEMCMPLEVGDYTDFYSSIEHATNVGTMFRDPNNALLPNWKHLPVGYHGRSSSIVVSGTPVHRPKGQTKADDQELPSFGPSRLLDFELEMGFVTFDGKPLGQSISTTEAEDYIFGMVLFNDWSARDIQKWEYVPLGPFLAKNFASSISPWIVTLDALEPFRVSGPKQEPEVLPYLQFNGKRNFDIELEMWIEPENGKASKVCSSNYKYMYWNMCQQLAHHTVNGCNVRVGDLMASGTISGPDPSSYGSMLELSWKGTKPVQLADGEVRKFIQDFDTVTMKGFSRKDGLRIGFGEVNTKVLPAL